MKISSISNNNFGAVLMVPPQVNVPVPAIVRSVDKVQKSSVGKFLPKFNNGLVVTKDSPHASDMFVLREAVVPDTKIRVIGLPHKQVKQYIPTSRLKGPGRKFAMNNWVRR